MRRYYALYSAGADVKLVKELDGTKVLGEVPFHWEFGKTYFLRLQVEGSRLKGWVGDRCLFDITDSDRPLTSGAVALVCQEGRAACNAVTVEPV